MSRAQTALEYLIMVVAGFIVIGAFTALVASTGVDRGADSSRGLSLAGQRIGVQNYIISSAGGIAYLINNGDEVITITDVSVEGVWMNSSSLPMVLGPYQEGELYLPALAMLPGVGYRKTIVFNYTTLPNGLRHQLANEDLVLAGVSQHIDNEILVSEPVAEGLVALWHFDEVSYAGQPGEVRDISRSEFHGQGMNGVIATEGVMGRAVSFDGVNDYMNGTTLGGFGSQMGNNFSFAFWMRTNSTLNCSPFGQSNGAAALSFFFFMNSNNSAITQVPGYLFMHFRDDNGGVYAIQQGGTTQQVPISDGEWHHYAIEVSPSNRTMNVYFDGGSIPYAPVRQDAVSVFGNMTREFALGARNDIPGIGLSMFCNVSLDEFGIWNRSISAEEVRSLYLRGQAELSE